jgi:preprotein translocase subunit SecA
MSPTTMATLRRYIAEPTQAVYTDDALDLLYDNNLGDINATAAEVWSEKAAQAAILVDTSEGDSSRKNSQVFTQAQQQAKMFDARAATVSPSTARSATTRAIERA